MAGELLLGLGAFKTMLDLAKGLKDISDATTRNAVAIELQEKILAAHAQQAALLERIGDLDKEISRLKSWDADKGRYELRALPPGVHVYSLKSTMTNGEPPHHLCQTCYQRDRKSILHQSETHRGVYHLRCNECGADLQVGQYQPPRGFNARRGSGWMGD
jgi:hypothetical protein